MITDFKIISKDFGSPEKFQKEVARHLFEGWSLKGELKIPRLTDSVNDLQCRQVLVKYKSGVKEKIKDYNLYYYHKNFDDAENSIDEYEAGMRFRLSGGWQLGYNESTYCQVLVAYSDN